MKRTLVPALLFVCLLGGSSTSLFAGDVRLDSTEPEPVQRLCRHAEG